MASQVEHITDLGLVNYVQHPSNPDYIVFRFADVERATTFQTALEDNKIWYERSEEMGRMRLFYLFGVHRHDYDKVQRINFEVEAKHRDFIIGNTFLRWFLILFSTGIITLAFVGYCTSNSQAKDTANSTHILNE